MTKLNTIEEALHDLKLGRMIIVVDDENRENEGDFVMCADMITPEAVNFMATFGRGMICAPITQDIADRLELPLQANLNNAPLGTAFTVTVDAIEGVSTGISAKDRAITLKLLADPSSRAPQFSKPGHIFPLIAKKGGVLVREGHTEASVDLALLCGMNPVGVICEIMNEDGSMARMPDLEIMAQKFDLKIISIEDLVKFRKSSSSSSSPMCSRPQRWQSSKVIRICSPATLLSYVSTQSASLVISSTRFAVTVATSSSWRSSGSKLRAQVL